MPPVATLRIRLRRAVRRCSRSHSTGLCQLTQQGYVSAPRAARDQAVTGVKATSPAKSAESHSRVLAWGTRLCELEQPIVPVASQRGRRGLGWH